MNSSTSFIQQVLVGLSCLTISATPLPGLGLKVEDLPNPRQENRSWVTSMANILSNRTEAQLNQIITQLEATNRAETELFDRCEIGKAEQDKGALFLISMDDRWVEIKTGYGIEAILPDAQVGHIINPEIMPHFKQDAFNDGSLTGTQAIDATVTDIASDDSSDPNLIKRPRSNLKLPAPTTLVILVGRLHWVY